MKSRILLVLASAIALVGVAAFIVVILGSGALSAQTSTALIIAASTLVALLGIAAVWVLGLRSSANARATRLANLERRMAALSSGPDARQLDPIASELESLRASVVELRRVAEKQASDATQSLVKLGEPQDLALTEFLSPQQVLGAVREAVAERRILDVLQYIDAFPTVLDELDLEEARRLFNGLRRLGYLDRSVAVMRAIAVRSGAAADARAAAIYASELALYRGEIDLAMELRPLDRGARANVVLHLVGKVLPETQSGYTLRSQYTVEAQVRAGIEPVVVAHAGASDRDLHDTETYEFRGIRYFVLGGPRRGTVPWDEWLRANVDALAELVREIRPAAIHAHSDFMNPTIALPVARAYGIPLVNETRGFWEESWLSRVASAEGWADVHQATARYGLPDMYRLRVEREAETRRESDAVVTLARVMQEHIERTGRELGMPAPKASVAPNAVLADDFPVVVPDQDLRERLGLPANGIVLGYISSIVEYEGIDTLLRAMFELEMALEAAKSLSTQGGDPRRIEERRSRALADLVERLRLVQPGVPDDGLWADAEALVASVRPLTSTPLSLLIVGEGAELAGLRSLAEELGLQRVHFSGRVPHEQVLSYYSLIDLFVVPRNRAAVTELVTPLKPFEAMATGRPCVFSDVRALAEIAGDSGCVELFSAGDHHDLALTVARLLRDPERLEQMSTEGARWVRAERSWDGNARTYVDVYRSLGLPLAPAA